MAEPEIEVVVSGSSRTGGSKDRENILKNAKWELQMDEPSNEAVPVISGDVEVSVLKKTIQHLIVPSPTGDVHVTVEGDTANKHALFTYPDIGLNHSTCFRSLFAYCGSKSIFRHFTIYHIDPPGHQAGAEDIPDDAPQLTMDDLAEQVESVRAHFGVEYMTCIGTGAGSSVFLHYALNYEKYLRGLVLTCPTAMAPTYYQKGTTWLILWRLQRWGLTYYMKKKLMARWFSLRTNLMVKDVSNSLMMEIDKTKPKNIYRYFAAYINRRDIREELKACRRDFKTLLISGDEYQPETLELNSCLRPEHNTWMEISNTGTAITEERPDEFASPLQLFLNGMGYI